MSDKNTQPREQATSNIAWSHELQKHLMVADDQGDDDLHNLLGEVACCLAALTGRPDTALAPVAAPEAPNSSWFDSGMDTGIIPAAATTASASTESFADWLKREMPAGTVIGDPAWWAPRILRAALAATEKKEQK